MENKLNIIVHVKDTKEVIFKTAIDVANVDDDDAVTDNVVKWMADVYGAKEVYLIEQSKYEKYQDYCGLFFVNKDNYFEVTFDIDNPNDCHVFKGSF